MAINLSRLCKFNISLANNIFLKSNFLKAGVRSLYTEQDLGVTKYEGARYTFHNQFVTIEDTFRHKMTELCEKDGVVYTEDLKAILHLANNNESDINLVNKMVEKYVICKTGQKLGAYVFGPVLMRLFYYLDAPQVALNVFNNPVLSSELYYHAIFRVLMCLLFKHGMYKEMRDVYDKFITTKGVSFVGRSSILFYAACLKENSLEAYEDAITRWKEECTVEVPSLRSCSLVALIALRNNAPEIALEILSVASNQYAISVRCIKLLTYLHMERYLQIVPILQHAVEQADSGVRRRKFFADVLCAIEDKVKGQQESEHSAIISLIRDLQRLDLMDSSCTLEEFLLTMVAPNYNANKEGNQSVSRRQNRPDRGMQGNRPRYQWQRSPSKGLRQYI